MSESLALGARSRFRIGAILAVALLLSGGVLWGLLAEFRAQEDHRREMAGFSAGHVSAEIAEMLETRRDGLEALSRMEGALLAQLVAHPHDLYLRQRLKDLLDARFADFYTFNLASPSGEPLIDGTDARLGEQCRADLRRFAAGGRPPVIVHPGPDVAHYDLMTRWGHEGQQGILFVSFDTDAIARWLSYNEAPGNRLLLARTDRPGQIDIGDAGPEAQGGALSTDALARVDNLGARAVVAGAAWEVVAVPRPGLMDAAWRRTVLLMLGVVLVSLLVGVIAVWAVLRDARSVRKAEEARRRGQEDLERRVRERTEALSRERDFVDAVVGAAGNVIVVLDQDGRLVRINRAAEEVTGYAADDLVGKPLWDILIPPERQADVRWVFDNLKHGKIVGTYENEWVTRDGSRRLFDWRNSVLHDEHGQVTHIIAQGYDITERKATELQLRRDREQQAVLEELLKTVLRGGALEETLGRCLEILLSVSWLALLPKGGVFLNEGPGEGLRLATSHNLPPEVQAACARLSPGRCLCDRAAESCELQYAECVDALREIRCPGVTDHGHYSVPLLVAGQVLGVLVLYLAPGFQRDPVKEAFITATADILAGFIRRKRDELALRASENLTRAVMDSLNSTIAVLDHRGKIIGVNRAWRDFARENDGSPLLGAGVGLDYLEAVRRAAAEDPDARKALDGLLGVLERGEPLFSMEYPCHSADEERWFLLQATPLNESAKGLVVSHTNITMRKQAERRLQSYAQVVETSGDLLCLIDRQGRYEVANPAYAALFDSMPAGLMGQRLEDVMGAEMHARIAPHLAAAMGGEDRIFSVERVFPDGRRHVLDAEYRPFRVEGEVQGVVASIRDVTEQVDAEEAAQEADRLFRDTMEASLMGIYIIQDGKFRYVNPSYAALFGYGPGELVDRMGPLDLLVPEQRAREEENLRRRAEGEPGRPYELKGLRKDGSTLDILVWGKGIRYRGQPASVGTLVDITASKQAEAALRESEQILERAQAMAHVGSWTADVAARTFSGSDEAHRVFGLPKGPTPWDEVFATFHPEDHDRVKRLWEDAGPLDIEFRLVVAGVTKWVHTRAEMSFDAEGHPVRANGMVQDITETREAQRALEAHRAHLEELVSARTAALVESENRARLILESTADGLFGVDIQGRFTFLNPAACAMLGYAPEVLVGRPVHETIHHSQVDGTPIPLEACPMLLSLQGGKQLRREDEVFWRVDGTWMPVAYALQPMYRDGRIVGAVVSFLDISTRREAEAAREMALAEAERLARVRSEFLANMSHEIRTPLNAVLGLAQVGLRGSDRRKSHDTFARILDSGQLLLGIVNDILDFSKIEAGRLVLEQGFFSPAEVVDRVVAMVSARAYGKGLDFRLEESANLPESCSGDALRLSQILVNLLSNAVKFTEGGRVTFKAERQDGHLLFSVADTGIGMNDEQLSRLFSPFEQADGSTTRRFGGTGLGLAISKRLVEMMRGELRVASRPGEGTVFTVRLPMLLATDRQTSRSARRVALHGFPDMEREVLGRDLGDWGIVVLDEAEARAGENARDLLICDAEVSGQALEEAVATALRRGVRVAMLVTPGREEPPAAWWERTSLLERPLRARHITALLESTADATVKPGLGTQRLAGIAVLAAEDNEVNRLVLREMLEAEGAELTCLDNGREAADQLAQTGPEVYDIVLTDVQMPVMDGYETARAIHALDRTLPVIGITAHVMAEDKARCLAAGMVEHLAKPLELESLVAAVLRHARRQPKAGTAATLPETRPPATAEPEAGPARVDDVIDWARLEARFGGKRDFVNKLARTALDSQREAPGKLRAALAEGDHEAVAFLAHSLKGMGGNLMAVELQALAATVEAAARGREEGGLKLAESLAQETERLLAALAERSR